MAGPILGIDFLKQFNVTVAPGSTKILFEQLMVQLARTIATGKKTPSRPPHS